MFENTDLRNTPYTGFTLPPQAIPTKKKDKRWKEACMDALENIGIRQISRKIVAFNDSFRILQGDFKYKDVANTSAFLSELDFIRSQTNLKTELKHFGFIEPIVNHLIGEYIKMPDPKTITAVDPYSKNDYIEVKTEKLWETVNKQVEDMLNMKMIKQGINPFETEFASQEEQDAYLQQIQQFKQQNTPSEIEKYMNQSWRATYIEWAEQTLESDYVMFDIDEKDRISLYQYLATGQCFRHLQIGYDYYEPENWHVCETFSDDEVVSVEYGDYVGQIKCAAASEIIAKWGHKMTADQKERLLRSKDYDRTSLGAYKQSTTNSGGSVFDWATRGGGTLHAVPYAGYYPYQNGKYIQQLLGTDLGYKEDFPNGSNYSNLFGYYDTERTDLIRYVYAYWVSYQKIGYLTLFDEEIGELVTERVTDEILPEYLRENEIKQLKTVSIEEHERNPQPNTIVWDYIKQVWKGLKICKQNTDLEEDLYFVEPLEYQLRGNSQDYQTRLPVVGINEPTSFVSRLEEEQKAYNIAMNMAMDYMSKELGIFFVMDMSFLPTWLKDMGGQEGMLKLTEIIRELGILPADGSPENTRSNFNQWQSVNADLTAAMLGKLEYAQAIKRMAFEKVGFSPERLGMPTPNQKTATGINQATNASFNQTEVWFDKFSKFQKRYNETHLNLAQYLKKDGIDGTVDMVDSYQIRTFLNFSDPMLPLRRFRIQPEASTKRRSELEILKQTYFQDNTIEKSLEDLAQVISADSTAKVIQLARYGKQMAQLQQERLHQQELQKIQAQQQGEAEREEAQRQWEAKEADLDRRAELLERQIVALGFTKDNPESAQVIEETRLALEKLKNDTAVRKADMDRRSKEMQDEKANRLKERELDIKERETAIKERAVTIPLEVAEANKTQYELEAKTRQKEAKAKKK